MKNKQVKYITMDISCHGSYFHKVKYYPAKEDCLDSLSLRAEDGLWFGLDLNQQIPINVHLFFFDGRWNTNCEFCERYIEGGWNHYYDSNISCKNVKVKYQN
ncbi:MAG: hypothetical protein IJV10_04585 [Prevotella sp.]|nr:hypothetical protein [Prevotella sp.]